MKLPNHQQATVLPEKITGYLLSDVHRDGRHKAVFFKRFGFRSEDPEVLIQALLEHAAEHSVSSTEPSPFGLRYVIDGAVRSPDGRNPMIRVVWFIETGATTPRFVTAYPQRSTADD